MRIPITPISLVISGVLLVIVGCLTSHAQKSQTASTPATFLNSQDQTKLSGYLYQPEGQGPFPALVLLHGCGGITRGHHWWATQLQRWGYMSLIVDSLGPRNVSNICKDVFLNLNPVDVQTRVWDAYGAWDYLRRQGHVDVNRIGIMGWSNGGITVLTALNQVLAEVLEWPRNAFRAAVAWYPYCVGDRFTTPLLTLTGERDDWTPAQACRQMMKDLAPDSAPVNLKIYPEAHHGFDRLASGRIIYHGHVIERHSEAVAQAKVEVKQFLGQYLAVDGQTQ